MNIQALPRYIIDRAVTLAPEGVAVEDVQAKLISVIKTELGKHTVTVSKDGFAKVSKKLEVSWQASFKAELTADADTAPIKFYRFCDHARKTQADFGAEAEIALPSELMTWLSKVVGSMEASKTSSKAEEVPATKTEEVPA